VNPMGREGKRRERPPLEAVTTGLVKTQLIGETKRVL
jgi:hypothetical protein